MEGQQTFDRGNAPAACVVIPARYASTRLPGKMLLRETGRTLIEHTYQAALRSSLAQDVVVATDHELIAEEVTRFGGKAILTSPDCQSGADRVAEASEQMPEYEIFVNLQGDEPEIDPAAVDRVIRVLQESPGASMATVAAPLEDIELLHDPSVVKVVFDRQGRALYFSRSPIPFVRDDQEAMSDQLSSLFHHHVGLYAYRQAFLRRFTALPTSLLEQAEKLEQLRVLEAGESIYVGVIDRASSGIDTPADYAAFVSRCYRRRAA